MNGYEYDDESDGMRAALEKARDSSQGGVIDLDALMADMSKDWQDEPEQPASEQPEQPPAEQPPDEEWARMKYEMRQNDTRAPSPSPLVEKMASVGWSPQEKAAPWSPGWQELHEKLGETPAQTQQPTQPSDPEALLKQVSELDAAKKAEAEKAAAEQAAKQAEQSPPPEQALLQQNSEIEAQQAAAQQAQKAAAEAAEKAAQKAPAPPPEYESLLKQHGEVEAAQKAEAEKAAAAQAAKAAAEAEARKPPPGPDWDAMLQQLQEAEHSRDTMGNVGAMLHAAAPGFQAPHGVGEGDVAAAKSAIELQQRKHKEASELLEQTKKAAHGDPRSPESQRAREAFTAQFPEAAKVMKLEALSADEIAGLSQREVQLEHYRASDTAVKARAAEKEAAEKAKHAEKEAAERAKQAEKDKNAAELQKALEAERGAMGKDPRLQKIGLKPADLAGMDRKGLDDARSRLESYKEPKPHGGVAKPLHALADISDPGTRAEVGKILDNMQLISSVPARGGEQERIRRMVHQIDPKYSELKAKAYADVQHQQALAPDVVAMSVGRHHLKLAEEAIPDNADARFINQAKQAFAQGTGGPEFAKFNTAAQVSAHEVAKVMKIDDQAGKQMVEHMLSPVQSRAQLLEVFHTIDELIAGKQEGLKENLRSFANHPGEKPAGDKPPLETRTSGGAKVYRARSGAKRWFTTPEEAETM